MIKVTVFLAVIIGLIFLQIFLSKKQNKWLGLILPLMCLIFSLITMGSIATFFSVKGELSLQQISPEGEVIEEVIVEQDIEPVGNLGTTIFQILVVLAIYNIPTGIFLAIYFACREQFKKNSMLGKMNIQDLE